MVVTAAEARFEADGGGTTAADPSFVTELTGTTGKQLGELQVWRQPATRRRPTTPR